MPPGCCPHSPPAAAAPRAHLLLLLPLLLLPGLRVCQDPPGRLLLLLLMVWLEQNHLQTSGSKQGGEGGQVLSEQSRVFLGGSWPHNSFAV
jgi:hypothetical protein